jgi:hypothetical protein
MPENDQIQPNPPVETPAPPTAVEHIDPAEYAQVQARNAQLEATFESLNPHAQRIKRMLDDPDYVRMIDETEAAAEAIRARQAPRVPPELAPIDGRLSKLEQVADEYLNARKAEAERPQREFAEKWNKWQNDPINDRFYRRLTADHPDLDPSDFQWLAQRAAQKDFASLETIWKENEWRFVQAKREAPPPSLRANAGDVGIPGPSSGGAPKQSMRERIVELERPRFRAS